MPRITIDYDSDSSFERNHLELSTHQQILARYISVRDDKKLPPKEKVMKLEHASEKTFLALKRVEIKLAKANEEIAALKEKLETDGTEAGLKQQLELEREKSTNRELKRELLVYEGVLPSYLDTQGRDWINSRRRKWTKENKELKEERDAAVQFAAMELNELSPYEKIKGETARLKEQNIMMNVHLETAGKVHNDAGAMAPHHLVRLAEENMVLKARWEKGWELSAGMRAKNQAKEDKAARAEEEMQNESFEDWKNRKEIGNLVNEAQECGENCFVENRGGRWRKRNRGDDEDFELSDVERRVVIRKKPSFRDE